MNKKGFGALFIAICLITAVSCSKEEAADENALTRGASVNDSQKQGGLGMTITINDEWEGDTVIHY